MPLNSKRGKTARFGLAAIQERRAEKVMGEALDSAERVYVAKRDAIPDVLAERARCLAHARKFPDNLMARHLAGLIEGGE